MWRTKISSWALGYFSLRILAVQQKVPPASQRSSLIIILLIDSLGISGQDSISIDKIFPLFSKSRFLLRTIISLFSDEKYRSFAPWSG